MGIVFAILGVFVLLAMLLIAAAFWLLAIISITAFVMGGILAMVLFGGGQDAFYIGGILSAVIALVVVAAYSSRVDAK